LVNYFKGCDAPVSMDQRKRPIHAALLRSGRLTQPFT
jgi:hypothetical protein